MSRMSQFFHVHYVHEKMTQLIFSISRIFVFNYHNVQIVDVCKCSGSCPADFDLFRGVASTQQHDDKAWSTTHFGTTVHTHIAI